MEEGIEYDSYYKRYIEPTQSLALLEGLSEGQKNTVTFFRSIPLSKHEYRYETDKWTPKEILLHLIDTERVFSYRALQFARAKGVVLEGYDQDEFIAGAKPVNRTMQSLLDEYNAVRAATLHFAKSCSDNILIRKGIASNCPLSVRAALRIICGHEMHHITIIKQRYL